MSDSPSTKCPFCGFIPAEGEYEVLLHIEAHHSESPSPFIASNQLVLCPHDACGEQVPQDELAFHLELHELEGQGTPEPTKGPSSRPPKSDVSSSSHVISTSSKGHARQAGAIQAWKDIFSGQKSRDTRETNQRSRHRDKKHANTQEKEESIPIGKPDDSVADKSTLPQEGQTSRKTARLGKAQLGRFAHEKQMPDWLVTLLETEGQVVNEGIMPVLYQLLEQNPSTQYAYLCHRHVKHISKLKREGGFCGYRNIQMLTSHIIGARSAGAERFGPTFPSIFQIQDLIENAWDMGFNSQGRVETGGVKGTRKYIGTPEAQAVFCSLNVPCSVQAFKDKEKGKAMNLLLHAIETYFQGGVDNPEDRIRITKLPPIYLQHPGHSLTIVGLEKMMNGQVNLLVFDPSFHDSGKMRQLVGKVFRHKPATVDDTLIPYRRDSSYLRKYSEFEVLYLIPREGSSR